jgi:hypothetical protein
MRQRPKAKAKARRGRRMPHQPGAAFRSDLGMVEEVATEDEREAETEAETEDEQNKSSHGRSNTSSVYDGRNRPSSTDAHDSLTPPRTPSANLDKARWVVPRVKPPLAKNTAGKNAAGNAQAPSGPWVPRAKPPLYATGKSGERESERDVAAFNKRFMWNRDVNVEPEQRRVERPPSMFMWRSASASSGVQVSPRNEPLSETQHDAEAYHVEEEEEEQWHEAGEVPENNLAQTPLNTTPPFTPREDDEMSEEEDFDEESDEESDDEAFEGAKAEFWSDVLMSGKAEAAAMERIARRRMEMRRAGTSTHSDNSSAADGDGGGGSQTDEQSEHRGGLANVHEAADAQTTATAAALSPDDVPISVSDEPTPPVPTSDSSPEDLKQQRERGFALRTQLDRLRGTAAEQLQSTQPPAELNGTLQCRSALPPLPPLPPLSQPDQQSAVAPRPHHRTSLDDPVPAQSTSVDESADASAAPPQTRRSFLLRNMPPVVTSPPPTASSSSNKQVAHRLAPGRPPPQKPAQSAAPKAANRTATLPSPRPTLLSPRPGDMTARQASANRLAALAMPRARKVAAAVTKAAAAAAEEAGAFSPRAVSSSTRDAAKPGWNTSTRFNSKPPPSRRLMGKR